MVLHSATVSLLDLEVFPELISDPSYTLTQNKCTYTLLNNHPDMLLTFWGPTVNTLNEEVFCVRFFVPIQTMAIAPYMLLTKGVMREIVPSVNNSN